MSISGFSTEIYEQISELTGLIGVLATELPDHLYIWGEPVEALDQLLELKQFKEHFSDIQIWRLKELLPNNCEIWNIPRVGTYVFGTMKDDDTTIAAKISSHGEDLAAWVHVDEQLPLRNDMNHAFLKEITQLVLGEMLCWNVVDIYRNYHETTVTVEIPIGTSGACTIENISYTTRLYDEIMRHRGSIILTRGSDSFLRLLPA